MAISAKDLHNDLAKIITWTFQRKISFNLDCTKQTQKFIFSEKIQNTNDTCLIFNHKTAGLIESQKYLGIVFDFQLDFKEHLEIIFKKVSKTMGLLHKLYKLFSRKWLITIYKPFTRTHLDYGNIICDQAYNASFHRKLESIQSNAALAITEAIRRNSKANLY